MGLIYAPKQIFILCKEIGKLIIDIVKIVADRMPIIIHNISESTKEINNNLNKTRGIDNDNK
jgi:hypothetical protein